MCCLWYLYSEPCSSWSGSIWSHRKHMTCDRFIHCKLFCISCLLSNFTLHILSLFYTNTFLNVFLCLNVLNHYSVKLLLVILFLDSTHLHSQNLLHFCRKRFLHIFLNSTQKERFQLFVQTGVARVPSFPMLLLKQLPWVKPQQHTNPD